MCIHLNLSPIAIRLKKCVIKLSILLLLQCNAIFLNALDIYLVFDSTSDQYKIQEMCEKAVHNFLIF